MLRTRLTILCLVSGRPGHIDFGGLGFVRLAESLAARGHRVSWLCPEAQCARLLARGLRVDTRLPVDSLVLNPLLDEACLTDRRDAYTTKVAALRRLADHLRADCPDLILSDRVLALAPLLAANLRLPIAVVGTIGEFCRREGTEVRAVRAPVPLYQEIGEALKRDLGWGEGGVDSFWARSPDANISFLPRTFYADATAPGAAAWHVHHFSQRIADAPRSRHGISFGHSGDAARMTAVAESLLAHADDPRAFELFCGDRDAVHRRFSHAPPGPRIHRWVPFDQVFPVLRTLTCFGGIGTLWHAIDHGIQVMVVPGGIGDQGLNGERAEALGLGACCPAEADLGEASVPRWRAIQGDRYREAIAEARQPEHYSDTLEGATRRLEQLARKGRRRGF